MLSRITGSFLVLLALATRLSAASVQLEPLNGQVQGIPGSAVGWGFSIVNDSPVDWISFAVSFLVNETNPSLGTFIDLIGPQGGPSNFVLAPSQPWTQAFSEVDFTGVGLYLIDPAAIPGALNSGQIRIVWETFNGDPFSCNCDPTQSTMDFDVQIGVAAAAPEPGSLWLWIGGASLLALRFMRRYRQYLRMLLLSAAFAGLSGLHAQTFEDIVAHSDPFGQCGAPGVRACSTLYGCAPVAGNIVRSDPYTAQLWCNLPANSCTFPIPPLSFGPRDFTYLVATDLHFGRDGLTSEWHALHTRALNQVYKLGLNWGQAGAGMPNVPIARPMGLVVTGDTTNGGLSSDLGAYRLLYEPGRLAQSIEYPVYPGLGNHDVDNECAYHNCAHRTFDYTAAAAACGGSVDPASHSYSWDVAGVHMIQLEKWGGDTSLGVDSSDVQYYHPSGLTWLAVDLATRVGTSGRPVIIFQHFGWDDKSLNDTDNDRFPWNPGGHNLWWTDADRLSFLNIIKDYNVAGIFSGHQHTSGMYATSTRNNIGVNFDNFTGGNGGFGGKGQFFAFRLTDKFLDVVPFEWTDAHPDPQITHIGFGSGITYPPFYNAAAGAGPFGCRKWIGGPLPAVPLTVSLGPSPSNKIVLQNNTGARLNGPFAVGFQLHSGHWLRSASFVGSCSRGPVYEDLGVDSLAPGESISIDLDLIGGTVTAAYSPAEFSVVALGADSVVASPISVSLPSSAVQTVDLTSIFGRNVAFSFSVDHPWVRVTADNNQTPAQLKIEIQPGATQFSRGAIVTVTPSDARYAAVHIAVNLATVPIQVDATFGDPLVVDGIATLTPTTFNWFPGDPHTLQAPERNLGSFTDRFSAWNDGASSANRSIATPLAATAYNATYQRFYRVAGTVTPAGAGQIVVTPSSADGFYLSGTPVQVQATPSANFVFTGFTGLSPKPPGNFFQTSVSAPLTFTANFVAVGSYSISTSLAAGGTETVDGVAYTGPASVQWNSGTQHTIAVPAIVTGAPGVRDVFTTWSDGVAQASRTVIAGAVNSYFAQYQRQYLATTSISPAGAGTLTGAGWYDDGSPAAFQATAANGFQFGGFSGDALNAQNPASLITNRPLNVIANFTAGTPSLAALPGPRNDTDPNVSIFTFVLMNSGAGGAAAARIDSVSTQTIAGTGTVTVAAVPLDFGTILPGGSATQTIKIDWPQSATRVAFTVRFSANAGAYHGQTTFYVLR